jgi:hypothetical protein
VGRKSNQVVTESYGSDARINKAVSQRNHLVGAGLEGGKPPDAAGSRDAGEELSLLDEIAREGERRRLIEALKAAVNDYVERHRSERDEQGHVLVMRNGRVRTRQLRLGAGTVELNARPIDERRVSISTTTIVSI